MLSSEKYTVNSFNPNLPKELKKNYWRIHKLRDILVYSHLALYEIKKIAAFKIDITDKIDNDQQVIDYALAQGKDNAKWFVVISLFDRLLNDFCHYTYFGLLAIHPAHIAPAYTLLRKPFEQTLPLIEYFLDKPEDFFEKFSKNIGDLDSYLSKKNESLVSRRKNLLSQISFPFPDLFDELENITHFDSSVHLITTRSTKTKNLNINFVFLNEDKQSADEHASFTIYMSGIYLTYANILFLRFIKSIDENNFTKPKKIKSLTDSINENSITIQSYALMICIITEGKRKNSEFKNVFNLSLEGLKIKCSKCNEYKKVKKFVEIQQFADYETLVCQKCKNPIIIQ